MTKTEIKSCLVTHCKEKKKRNLKETRDLDKQ